LWNGQNQCKPSFYAVANVGINYNELDSIIAYANLFKESEYTTASWAIFAAALTSAKNAKAQNYSYVTSADTALAKAKEDLQIGIISLRKTSNSVYTSVKGSPQQYELGQNYPNPFNPTTQCGFRIAEGGMAKLSIFDLLGREVAVLVNEKKEAGMHTVQWDASTFSSGIYLYKLTANQFTETKKMILTR
jgi:hypothetical protein